MNVYDVEDGDRPRLSLPDHPHLIIYPTDLADGDWNGFPVPMFDEEDLYRTLQELVCVGVLKNFTATRFKEHVDGLEHAVAFELTFPDGQTEELTGDVDHFEWDGWQWERLPPIVQS